MMMENRINIFIFSAKLYPSSTGSTSHSSTDMKPDKNQSTKLFIMAVGRGFRRPSENRVSDGLGLFVFVKTAAEVGGRTFAQQYQRYGGKRQAGEHADEAHELSESHQ